MQFLSQSADVLKTLTYLDRHIEFELSRKRKPESVPTAILISGEEGTGRRTLGRYIASRLKRTFQISYPEDYSRENSVIRLFGYTAGVFPGAPDYPGALAASDKGVFFFHEIENSSHDFQSSLMRPMDTGEVRKFGELRPRYYDIQFIFSMRGKVKSYDTLLKEGRLYHSFLSRVCGICFHLPPLRERPEDILFYAKVLIQQSERQNSMTITPCGERALLEYSWPGNITELSDFLYVHGGKEKDKPVDAQAVLAWAKRKQPSLKTQQPTLAPV